MKCNKVITLLLCFFLGLSLLACGNSKDLQIVSEVTKISEDEMNTEVSIDAESETVTSETEEIVTDEIEGKGNKQVIVYYPNWYLGSSPAKEGGEVGSIAWDAVTMINHAFFAPYPDDGTTESSFDRKANNLEPRTAFKCISTSPKADFEDEAKSEYNDAPRNHFKQYEIYNKQYPDVKILISVGGWSRSGYFSEMSMTAEGRTSFINSLITLMKDYPFIAGIDIDWEYPGGSLDGQRLPEGPGDEGCPIWESPTKDNENFALLLEEMRNSFNKEFGEGEKLITACASASTGWTLPCQNWPLLAPHLDYINVMTYDLAGKWDGITGHHSPENLTKSAIAYFLTKKIDITKVNIGSPMYPIWLKVDGDTMPKYVVGAKIDKNANMTLSVNDSTHTQQFEKESVTGYTYSFENGACVMGEKFDNSNEGAITGWNSGFDEKAGAAYLYNNDPSSPFYMWYATYENPLSLQRKLDLILHYKLAGIIVWESTQDTHDHLMINQMSQVLNK